MPPVFEIRRLGHVHKSGFGVSHLDDRRRHEAEGAGAAVGSAVTANEGRVFLKHRQHGSLGTAISAHPYKGKVGDIKGVSDAPLGAKFSQSTHPQGVYNISTAHLIGARRIPARRPGQDQLRESIRSKGMDRPVHMRIWQDGKAEIWDGKHRAARAQEAGLKKVPVSVTHELGKHPKPTSIIEVRNRIQDNRYRKGLVRDATRLAKGDNMISAFGVEHVEVGELSKGLFGELGEHTLGALKGFKGGLTGARSTGKIVPKGASAAVKSTTAGGFKTGRFVRRNAKPLAIGGGIGLGAGALAGSSRNS